MASSMELRPLGATGVQVSAIGFGCQEVGGGYGDIDEREFAARRRSCARPRDQPVRHRRGVRVRRVGGGARPSAPRAPRRSHRVDQVRHRLPGPAQLPRRSRRAGARVDRREPAAPRYRPRRRVHRALARPRHAVRGDAWARSTRWCRRARSASSRSRTSPSTSCRRARRSGASTSCSTCTACSTGGWSPTCCRGARRTTWASSATASLAYGLLSGTLPADHHFPADDWRSKTDKWGVMSPLFEHLFGPGRIAENVAVVEDLRGVAAKTRTLGAAARAPVGHRDAGRRARHSSGAGPWPRSTTTPLHSTGRSTRTTATPSTQIFIRHGVNPCPDQWIEKGI